MKKILILALAIITISLEASAQIPQVYIKQAPDTCKNQDTVTLVLSEVASNIMGLYVETKRLTGTIAVGSYVIVKGLLPDKVTWELIEHPRGDSLAVDSQVMTNKYLPLTRTHYLSYMAYYITPSSTQTSVLRFGYLRRPDED